MREFISDTYINSFKGDWLDVFMGIFMWILTIMIVLLILSTSLYLIDSIGLKEKQGTGIVIEKWLNPAHNTTTFTQVGKVMIPFTHHYSDAWMIEVKINNITDKIKCHQYVWDKIKINQEVTCTYTKGRIYNSIYIKNILIK